jgi:hypothetical protein
MQFRDAAQVDHAADVSAGPRASRKIDFCVGWPGLVEVCFRPEAEKVAALVDQPLDGRLPYAATDRR